MNSINGSMSASVPVQRARQTPERKKNDISRTRVTLGDVLVDCLKYSVHTSESYWPFKLSVFLPLYRQFSFCVCLCFPHFKIYYEYGVVCSFT